MSTALTARYARTFARRKRRKFNEPARRQKAVRGGRQPLPACVLASIRKAVEERAAYFNVSKSFVVAVALAKQFGITDQELYE